MGIQHRVLASLLLTSSLTAQAGGKDNPFLIMPLIDQLETSVSDGDHPTSLRGELWAGYDFNRFWLKVDAESAEQESDSLELQALYSRAVSAFWNVQAGVRSDFNSDPQQDWAVIGIKGLAPYFFDVDVALFVGTGGRSALRIEAEYELMLTQKLVLSPDLELNAYGQNDSDNGVGAGLSDLSAGVRLRYEFRREFAPYLGVEWQKKVGNTGDFAADQGEDVEDTQFIVGLRMWF